MDFDVLSTTRGHLWTSIKQRPVLVYEIRIDRQVIFFAYFRSCVRVEVAVLGCPF